MTFSKKVICLLLVFVFVFGLCSCGGGADTTSGETDEELTSSAAAQSSALSESALSATAEQTTTESATTSKETSADLTVSTSVTTSAAQTISDTNYEPGNAVQASKMIITGEKSNGDMPYTALEKVTYEVKDPNNTRGLSNKKISHSHGPASGGKPHPTVVAFQDNFDKYGALTLDRKSTGKVLYLTFDCGWENNNITARILDTLKEKNVPAAFFCTLEHIKSQPELIKRMITEGHIVGNHSKTHPSFPSISRTQMKNEIEETENYLRQHFGYAAKYFRFPGGEYSDNALDLVASLGYMSVFWSVAYSDWDVNQQKGKQYAYDTVMSRLHPGAVILLHAVSKDNADALGDIIDSARKQGYEFKALTNVKLGD